MSEEALLRAMAQNYGNGPHQWDHLDKEACIRAADEIRDLKRVIAGLDPFPAPVIQIKCETRDGVLVGTTSLPVVRVDIEDDGSYTVVTDYWPIRERT